MEGLPVCWQNSTESSPNTALVVVCVLISALWTLCWAVLSPQLLGRLVTVLLRVYLKKACVSVGSININLLAGHILFKNLYFADTDNSFRAVDGYLSFPWWRRQKSHTSLMGEVIQYNAVTLQLNGFHYHWYNRDEAYRLLERKYQGDIIEEKPPDVKNSFTWSNYLPVIQCKLTKGSMVFGNSNVPTSLVVYFDSAAANYTVSAASNLFDEFLHVVVFNGSDMKAYLQPSVGYTGQLELPPVSVDRGFLFAQSDSAVITYAYDTPGIVQTEQMDGPGPRLSFAIEFGNHTVINYGPWAHRQRFFLQRLFVPHDFMESAVTQLPKLGERRIVHQLDVSFSATQGADICLLFRDEKGQTASKLQLSAGRDSHISICQPWITREDGYTTHLSGQVWQPQFTTDMPFPQAANGKNLEINVSLYFPRRWNSKQIWTMNFSAEDVACIIMIHYVDFFDALLTDWWGHDPADFCSFVPIEWTVQVDLSSYEVFVVTNRFNWIDISPGQSENTRLAFCGQTGGMTFEFPLTAFMPLEQKVNFKAAGQNLVVRRYLPPSCSTSKSVFNMTAANKQRWRLPKLVVNDTPSDYVNKDHFPMGVCNLTHSEDGWIDLAAGPEISIDVNYLSRRNDGLDSKISQGVIPPANSVDVQVKVPDAVVRLFGFLARDLLAIKENFVGDYPFMNTFDSTKVNGVIVRSDIPESVIPSTPILPGNRQADNILSQRFLDIHVDIQLVNVTAEFPLHPTVINDATCPLPSGYCSCLHLCVGYRMDGTQVMLGLEKISILLPGKTSSRACLGQVGCLLCPRVQINAQGYTEPLHHERVEYAWMISVVSQEVSGSVGVHQVPLIAEWLESAMLHAISPGDTIIEAPGACVIAPKVEPLSEMLKYKLLVVSVGSVSVDLCEEESDILLQTPGCELKLCNLQTSGHQWSISGLVPEINLVCLGIENSMNAACTHQELLKATLNDLTLDVRFKGTIHADRQADFLRTGDRRTQRLSFLWPSSCTVSHDGIPVCGCYGGCQFTSHASSTGNLQKSDECFLIDEEERTSCSASVYNITNPCDLARIHCFLFSIPRSCLSHQLRQTTECSISPTEESSFERGSTVSLDSFHSALSHVSKFELDADFDNSTNDPTQDKLHQQEDSALSLTEYSQSVHSLSVAYGTKDVGHISLRVFAADGDTPYPVLQWYSKKKQVPVTEQDVETDCDVTIKVELKDNLTIKVVPQAFHVLSKFVESVQTVLASQASMSVLDLSVLATQHRLASVLNMHQATPKKEGELDPSPALCFSMSMAENAYISAQLLDYSITAERMSHVTAVTNDLTVCFMLNGPKIRPQGPLYESADSGCNEDSQASSFGLSIDIPMIQLDLSSVSAAMCQKGSGSLNSEMLSFCLSPDSGSCCPLVQLSVNTVSLTAFGHFRKSRVVSPVLTFSDISKEDAHIPVELTNILSDVVISAELKQVQCHIIHTFQGYPSIIEHLDVLKDHCNHYILPAIQSTLELLDTVAAAHSASICSLLLSAASQSGRFLPKFTCLLSESSRKLRDTPVFQCLQQLVSLPNIAKADAVDLPPKEMERMIFSLAAAQSAKLFVMSRSRQPKSPGRSVLHDKIKPSSSARRFSIASQGSMQSGVTERVGPTSARYNSKVDSTQLYRRIFQKLGTYKIDLLVCALSPWLGTIYRRDLTEKSLVSLSVRVVVTATSLALKVPESPACRIVQLHDIAITGNGNIDKVFHSSVAHSKIRLQCQLIMRLSGIFVSVSAASEKLLAIMIMQSLQLPRPKPSRGHTSARNNDPRAPEHTTQYSDFGYSIVQCFEEIAMPFDQNDVPSSVSDAHQSKPASPCCSQFSSNTPADLAPLLPEPAVHFMTPSLSSRDEKGVMSSSPTAEVGLTDSRKPNLSSISASIQMDIAELHMLVEVETLQGKLDLTHIEALCTLSSSQRDRNSLSSVLGSWSFSTIFGVRNATMEFIDTNWELSSLMKLSLPEVTVLLTLIGGLGTNLTHQLVFNVSGVDFDLRQPPVILQKVVHLHISAFKSLYNDVMSAIAKSEDQNSFTGTTPFGGVLKEEQPKDKPLSPSRFLAVIGHGCSLMVIRRVALVVTVLPSLTLLYSATSFSVTVENDCDLKATLSCAVQNVKFSPKTQLEDIPVRNVNLPSFEVSTLLVPREKELLPLISLDLSINKIDLHLSTEILNQLLVVQSSFVKDVDELVDILGEIPQSVPHQTASQVQNQESSGKESTGIDSLLSALQTVKFSVQGVDVTVSTPSLTAVRFTTGRIEVLINNVQSATREYLLCLSGKVEVDVHFALGVFQDFTEDTDFFTELAVFTTKLSIKDTSQISDSGSDEPDLLPLDTYTLVIHSPHFFIQPSAVEQGLTFWLHCKVAYSYWQEERNAVNDEVQRATEHLLQRIHKPGEASIPKLDFARPKLVQITVSDVGVCIPLSANHMNADSRPKAMPALVVTIQEMRISINVLKKIAIVGRFAGFCARFSDWFTVRQKQWSADHKKKGIENSATVPKGSCKICLGIKSREGSNRIGVVSTLQWNMSGIDIHTKHDIGQQISSLARTIFSVSGDSDRVPMSSGIPPEASLPTATRLSPFDSPLDPPLNVMEKNLGKQGRRVHQMKRKGGGIEYIEQLNTLREMERETVRKLKTGSMKDRRLSVLNFKDAFLKSLATRPSDLPIEAGLSETEAEAQGTIPSTWSTMTNPRSSSRVQHKRARSEILPSSQLKWVSEHESAIPSEVTGTGHKKAAVSTQDYILDLDVNVSVNIASGSLSLHMASTSIAPTDIASPAIHRHGSGMGDVGFWSPAVPRPARSADPSARHSKRGDVMVVLLPALNVRANYASDFVKGLDDSSSLDSNSDSQQREGTLILSVSVQSLEREVVLSPSLPVFLEQVAQPISSATKDFSSKMDITGVDEDEGDCSETSDVSSLTFPIHVFIQFHLKPSTIILSCEPISHVQCSIGIPDMRLASSFSLFTDKEMDTSVTDSLDHQSYIATFNDFSVTGCLSSFYVILTCPPVSSVKLQGMKAEPLSKGPRKVFSLQMGLASLHISRKTFIAKTGSVIHDKQYISVVAEVASVLLGFDMRQLNNATAFRKCWYRKSLSEAVLFGNRSSVPTEPKSDSSSSGEPVSASVIVSADISDLTFSANFAQVMGDAGIVLTHFELQSHVDILRNELVQVVCRASVQSVDLDAKGGVVAGVISVSNAEFGVSTSSHEGQKPVHDAYVQVGCIDCRVDYMGATKLMGKATYIDLHICEQWQGSSTDEGQIGLPGVTIVVIFKWDTLKLIICKSTTRSIVNIVRRLTDFLFQQKARSETTLRRMLPAGINTQGPLQTLLNTGSSPVSSSSESNATSPSSAEGVLRHHHWLWATQKRTSSLFQALGIYSLEASRNMSLGGEVHVAGGSFSLVCLHGASFNEKEWGVFNMQTVKATFGTQAIPCLAEMDSRDISLGSTEELVRVCQQRLQVSLGQEVPQRDGKQYGGVYHVTSGRAGIPLLSSNTNVDDWLMYRCIEPFLSSEHSDTSASPAERYARHVVVEPILTIPAVTFDLTNDHFWPSSEILASTSEIVPKVKCHLETNFSQGISITAFAQRYAFLHEVITSYINDLEQQPSGNAPLDKGTLNLHCNREFVCETWVLDPTLVLIAGERWPSGKLNPHVSLLLDWLGFKEAKVTIPKWIQRGAMDPADLLFSKLVQAILTFSARKKTQE